MLKISSISILIMMSVQGSFVASVPLSKNVLDIQFLYSDSRISSTWAEHAKDFVDQIDVDKLVSVVFQYMNDPEVLNFVTFVFSDEFKAIVWEFESMVEFKEAFMFLANKGYDVGSAINFVNAALNLPPFEKPKLSVSKSFRGKGMTGLIEDVIASLPIEEMKKLFESKLETSPEVAELFETINSPEFMEIMKKMSKNPKFIEIKETFAGYGFDFKYLCGMAKDIIGEYYQGVLCNN